MDFNKIKNVRIVNLLLIMIIGEFYIFILFMWVFFVSSIVFLFFYIEFIKEI